MEDEVEISESRVKNYLVYYFVIMLFVYFKFNVGLIIDIIMVYMFIK